MQAESIKSIKYVGQHQTLNIEVNSDDHVYFANGIATQNSHGILYAMNSYASMYCKVYHPTEFYCAWLTFAGEKIDPKQEVYKLVMDAKTHGIRVLPPKITLSNSDFHILKDKEITFGLGHIRGIGKSGIKVIQENKENLANFRGFISCIKKLHRGVAESLIKSGACDEYDISRTNMLRAVKVVLGNGSSEENSELSIKSKLTDNEYKHFIKNLPERGFLGALESILEDEICTTKRREVVQAKIAYVEEEFEDTATQKSMWEKLYLGINLTCSAADDYTIKEPSVPCSELPFALKNDRLTLHVVIDGIKVSRTKETAKTPNAEFATLTVSDNSGEYHVMVWPKQYQRFKDSLEENSVAIIYGTKDIWQNKHQVVLNDIKVLG